jgi:uroporphyrinogen decarboxylase
MDLCFIREDDPELYADLFRATGGVLSSIWGTFLKEFGDVFCVCRFGDDLGFKTSTLIAPEDIRSHMIPVYKEIIGRVHAFGKPFLLHSCGAIFSIMDDLIEAGIDAKHSNEDQIAPFPEWVKRYGGRIGNFGGIDTDAVCRLPYAELKEYITDVLEKCSGCGGFAFGSGNSIPDYVPVEKYLNMVEIVRSSRGE